MYNEMKRPWAYRAPDDPPKGGDPPKEPEPKPTPNPKPDDNSTIRKMREEITGAQAEAKEAKEELEKLKTAEEERKREEMAEIDRLKAEQDDLKKAAETNAGAADKATELEGTLKELVQAKLDSLPEEKREQCEKFIGAAPLKDQLAAIDAFAANIPQPKPVGTGNKPPAPGDPNYKPDDPKPDDIEPVDLVKGMKNVGQMGFKQYDQNDVDRSLANPNGMSEDAIDALLDKKLKEREAAAKK